MTIMWCAFEGAPTILRVYGWTRAIHRTDEQWPHLLELFPAIPGARQIIELEIGLVQASCGTAVPLLDYVGEREALNTWAERTGERGIQDYWLDKNQHSIDGIPTDVARLNQVEPK
ncbi:MAG: hypothetical protein ACI8W8_003567 [Rhodothermales bacterium]|jgi:hypothetical protein